MTRFESRISKCAIVIMFSFVIVYSVLDNEVDTDHGLLRLQCLGDNISMYHLCTSYAPEILE